MKEFRWKSVVWVIKWHGDILQFRTKFGFAKPWRTVANFVNNPALNSRFRLLLADVAQELETPL